MSRSCIEPLPQSTKIKGGMWVADAHAITGEDGFYGLG
jgi:hypothetical protein